MIDIGWQDLPPGVTSRLDAAGWDDLDPISNWVSNVRALLVPFNATYDDNDRFHFNNEGDYAMFYYVGIR